MVALWIVLSIIGAIVVFYVARVVVGLIVFYVAKRFLAKAGKSFADLLDGIEIDE